MKLFKTNVIDTITVYQEYFGFDSPSITIKKQRKTFLARLDTPGYIHVH